MRKFKVPVVWTMWGVYEIESESEEDAKIKAEEYVFDMSTPLPDCKTYLDDSMEIDYDSCLYLEEVKD